MTKNENINKPNLDGYEEARPDFPQIWAPITAGEFVHGVFKGLIDGEYGQQVMVSVRTKSMITVVLPKQEGSDTHETELHELKKDEMVKLPAHTVLQRKIKQSDVRDGDGIYVEYLGEFPGKQLTPYRDYSVLIKKV